MFYTAGQDRAAPGDPECSASRMEQEADAKARGSGVGWGAHEGCVSTEGLRSREGPGVPCLAAPNPDPHPNPDPTGLGKGPDPVTPHPPGRCGPEVGGLLPTCGWRLRKKEGPCIRGTLERRPSCLGLLNPTAASS